MKTAFTKKIISFITIIVMFSLSLVRAQNYPAEFNNGQTINPLIGDISFVTRFGCQPDASTNEDLRIQTHLAYVENLLRQKDVSGLPAELQQKRTYVLDQLRDYWQAGKFPRNYDYPDVRKSCWIDKDNTICAVGYLVEKTAGRDVADQINIKHKYDFVYEMNDPIVDNWIAGSGLTKDECAMIQPDYWYNLCSGNKVWACRLNNCENECKCVNSNNVAHWQQQGRDCDGNNGGGNDGGGACICRMGEPGNSPAIYPNPASSSAQVFFTLQTPQTVSLCVYDISGRLMEILAEGAWAAGEYDINWNVENVNDGMYLIRLQTENFSQTERISVIR